MPCEAEDGAVPENGHAIDKGNQQVGLLQCLTGQVDAFQQLFGRNVIVGLHHLDEFAGIGPECQETSVCERLLHVVLCS